MYTPRYESIIECIVLVMYSSAIQRVHGPTVNSMLFASGSRGLIVGKRLPGRTTTVVTSTDIANGRLELAHIPLAKKNIDRITQPLYTEALGIDATV